MSETNWEKILAGLDFSVLEGNLTPEPTETFVKAQDPEKQVVLQKIVTEVWVYTDVEGKTFASTASQNIQVLGEMTQAQAIKIIKDGKNKGKKT